MKNILIGVIIGILGTTAFFLLIGEVDIKTDIQIGEESKQNNKDIIISMEKNIDDSGRENLIVNAKGSGSVTIKDIEVELEKLFTENNIDASSGVEVNITLDEESDFE